MPVLLVLIPLMLMLVGNLPFSRRILNVFAPAACALVCLAQAALAVANPACFWKASSSWATPLLQFQPNVDNLSLVMFLSIGIVGLVALLVGQHSIPDANRRFNFVNLLLLAVIGMNGVVLANDLFSLYVYLEVTAVASFILIALDRGRDAFEGAFKYVVMSALATTMILAALALLLLVSGSVTFEALVAAQRTAAGSRMVLGAVGLLVGGLFVKCGLIPFHGWLPDAYSSAPPPVSILLAGIVTKTTGVYALIRLVSDVLQPNPAVRALLLAVGAVSIVIGALAALGQKDFKRMLAYSSISQIGYIILGLGAGNALGLAGAVFHLFNHAIFKTLLFVNAAAVEQQTGTRNMDKLGGLADRMPVTGVTSVVAFLSTAGIPPFSGFWSKLIVIVAVWKAGDPFYAAIGVLASLLTLAYFLTMQRRVFFGKLADGLGAVKEATLWNTVPACLLALVTAGLGVWIPWIFGTFLLPVRSLL